MKKIVLFSVMTAVICLGNQHTLAKNASAPACLSDSPVMISAQSWMVPTEQSLPISAHNVALWEM
jgi:hypothetical protein